MFPRPECGQLQSRRDEVSDRRERAFDGGRSQGAIGCEFSGELQRLTVLLDDFEEAVRPRQQHHGAC